MKGLDLSSLFTTKAQATDFTDRLSRVESDLFETKFDLETELQNNFGVVRKVKFLTLLRENEVPIDSKQKLSKFFERVRGEISKLPEATITFAIEPNKEILNSISSWFLLNLNKQVLIDTQIDKKIIAGTVINYRGKRFDSSVRKEFERVIKNTGGSQDNQEKVSQPEAIQSQPTTKN